MSTEAAPLAGPREWIGLAALTGPALLIGLDFTVLHLVLPHLAVELVPSSVQMLWIVDIYGFVIAGMLIPMGALGDRIGRRRLLLIGSILFALASLPTAYATSPAMVIATRALLGLTGATLLPSTLSLITHIFRDDTQRRLAIAVWSTAFSIGNAAGPVIGGAMLERFWWGSVFLLGLPVMAALMVPGWLARCWAPPSPGPSRRPRSSAVGSRWRQPASPAPSGRCRASFPSSSPSS